MVNKVLALVMVGGLLDQGSVFLVYHIETLGHDDQAVAWDVVLLDRFGNNLLGPTVGVHIGRVPLQKPRQSPANTITTTST